jgi:hypothetical protein
MNDLAQRTIELATKDLGVHEVPPGSNRGPRIDEMLRTVGLDPAAASYAWCAAAVSTWIFEAAHQLALLKKFHGTASVHRMKELNPSLVIEEPESGCVCLHFETPTTGHAGLLVDEPGWLSIEGNSDANGSRTGGSVVHHVRPRGYWEWFLRIA